MAGNDKLQRAKDRQDDELYTLYEDIQQEIQAYVEYDADVFRDKVILCPCDDPEWSNFTKFFAANFENFGIKKLISTSYAPGSGQQISLFEQESPQFDADKSRVQGKIFTLERGEDGGRVDIDNLKWDYLDGDGDFQSEEVTRLRDEADFIITNPPFSLYIDMIKWLYAGKKKFLIIGNKSSITLIDVFPRIMSNELWSGRSSWSGGMWFRVQEGAPHDDIRDGIPVRNIPAAWFTNIDHGIRHQPIPLMTMAENLRFSKHAKVRKSGYVQYHNYDAIEVPFTDAIPKDYEGVMGVPITYLEKHCVEQYQIVGTTTTLQIGMQRTIKYHNAIQHNKNGTVSNGSKVNTRSAILVEEEPAGEVYYTADDVDGYLLAQYPRILIKKV